MTTTLGLDLGPNSIGWALVDADASKIIDSGVRVFPEGVDNFDTGKEISRNEQRRLARQMRRQHRRKRERKQRLRDALAAAGLWPQDPRAAAELLRCDPYDLRARALQEKLHPHEIGRILIHLNQRRGFLSLRKRERKDKEVAGMLAEIEHNEQQRQQAGHETIGSLLAEKNARFDHVNRSDDDHVRRRHLSRRQLEDEFDLIWQRQRELGHSHLLTDALKYGATGRLVYPQKPIEKANGATWLDQFGLHGLIFFQRPIWWPAAAVGRCELEPRHFRCPRADRAAQRFRMLQEVNNLRYADPDRGEEVALDDAQRELLLEKLATRKEMTFDQIRKALGFDESIRFNLERGERSKIKGHVTDHAMASTKGLGKAWYQLDERDRDRIVRAILDPRESDEQVEHRLVDRFGFTPQQAEAAVMVDLPTGYVDYSLKAIHRLLPELERGLVVMAKDESHSALHAAGYLRPDEQPTPTLAQLPALESPDCPITAMPNPVVRRALVELRKVVNGVIRAHGKPDAIHLEMAREVQQGPEARRESNRRRRQREDDRADAADKLAEMGEKVTREKIVRYLLWKEQQHKCPYTGRPISQSQLFGGDTDIDHVLPYSRSLDDSQMNKVLVFRDANREKGQRTVWEWVGASEPARFDQIIQRVRSMKLPYPKYKKFLQKTCEQSEFIARQLVDTGYIARVTGQYLRCLFDQPTRVLGLKGQFTSDLRWQWGLEKLLSELPDSPAWAEQADLRPGEKNRADHRHHAVDAVVLALTDRSRLQQLARIRRDGGSRATGEVLPDPWPDFRQSVESAITRINVSHRPRRDVQGQLHKEKPFSPKTDKPGTWARRKEVKDLSPDEISRIRDDVVRQQVVHALETAGIEMHRSQPARGRPSVSFRDVTSGKKATPQQIAAVLADPKRPICMPSGVPIRRTRVLIQDQTVQPLGRDGQVRYVKPETLHHAAMFRWQDGSKTKHDAVYVDSVEASRRLRDHKPIVDRRHPEHPEAEFLFSLCTGDMVLVEEDGRPELKVVSTLVSTQKRIHLVSANDGRRKRADVGLTPNTLLASRKARKVVVDPVGRIRWAND